MTTNYVHAYFDGKECSVKYWVEGDGADYFDYATSYDKLHAHFCKEFGVKALDLFTLVEGGKSKQLKNDKDVQAAMDKLDDQDSLAVQVYRRKAPAKGKGKKGKKQKQESDEDTDVEEEDSDDAEEEEADAKKYQKQKNKKKGQQQPPPQGGKKKVRDAKELLAILTRFAQYKSPCHYCDDTIPDVCYEWEFDTSFCICRACFNARPKDEKPSWQVRRPWTRDAPEAPLRTTPGWPVSDDVRHLQYLYTLLGLMQLEHTDEVRGSFQYYTAEATREFRKLHKIPGKDATVYDAKTAKKLGDIVRDMRKKGHKFV